MPDEGDHVHHESFSSIIAGLHDCILSQQRALDMPAKA